MGLTRSAGKNKEGEEASGTITVPEVAHDTEEDEYVVCSLRSHTCLRLVLYEPFD